MKKARSEEGFVTDFSSGLKDGYFPPCLVISFFLSDVCLYPNFPLYNDIGLNVLGPTLMT